MRRFGLGGLGGLFVCDSRLSWQDVTLTAAAVYVFPQVYLWASGLIETSLNKRFARESRGFRLACIPALCA